MRVFITVLGVILALMLIYWLLSMLLGALSTALVMLVIVSVVAGIVRYLWQRQQASPSAQAKRDRRLDKQAETELRKLERQKR